MIDAKSATIKKINISIRNNIQNVLLLTNINSDYILSFTKKSQTKNQ